MLCAIPRPIPFPLSLNVGWFHVEPADGKQQCPDRDSGWGGRSRNPTTRTADHGWTDTTLTADIFELPLQMISQLYDGVPREVGAPLGPQ